MKGRRGAQRQGPFCTLLKMGLSRPNLKVHEEWPKPQVVERPLSPSWATLLDSLGIAGHRWKTSLRTARTTPLDTAGHGWTPHESVVGHGRVPQESVVGHGRVPLDTPRQRRWTSLGLVLLLNRGIVCFLAFAPFPSIIVRLMIYSAVEKRLSASCLVALIR